MSVAKTWLPYIIDYQGWHPEHRRPPRSSVRLVTVSGQCAQCGDPYQRTALACSAGRTAYCSDRCKRDAQNARRAKRRAQVGR